MLRCDLLKQSTKRVLTGKTVLFFLYISRKNYKTDKIRDSHKSVEYIGDEPYIFGSYDSSQC